MEQELGAVLKTARCPEKLLKAGTFWVNILTMLVPGLLVSLFARGLLVRDLGELTGDLIAGGFALLFAVMAVLFSVAMKRRYSETVLEVCENGLRGRCPANSFKSRDFAFPYSELKDVYGKKTGMILSTPERRYVLNLDGAEELAGELKQKIS